MKDYRLFIFDKDGTICRSKTGKPFINSVEDQELIPGVLEKIAELKAQGVKIGIANNQGGVAFGYMSYTQADDIMVHAGQLIQADWVVFCPYHPEATQPEYRLDTLDRKPGPGMIYEIIAILGADNEEYLFVGDRPEDEQAAKNAGVDFMWAWQFFGWPEPEGDG